MDYGKRADGKGGKEVLEKRELVAKFYEGKNIPYNKTYTDKQGKEQNVDLYPVQVQLRAEGQKDYEHNSNLNIYNKKTKDPKSGETRYNSTYFITADQKAQIEQVAGNNKQNLRSKGVKNGPKIGEAFAFKADLIPNGAGGGLAVNTKTLEKSDLPKLSFNFQEKQFEAERAGAAYRKEHPEEFKRASKQKSVAKEAAPQVDLEDEAIIDAELE